jgi:hypothetical protein
MLKPSVGITTDKLEAALVFPGFYSRYALLQLQLTK